MSTRPAHLATGLLVCVMSGCQVIPQNNAGLRQYDLGFAPRTSIDDCKVRVEDVRTPASPGGTTLWYRNLSDPYELKPYAWSVWSAPPAELIRAQLQLGMRPDVNAVPITVEIHQIELLVREDDAMAILVATARPLDARGYASLPTYETATMPSPAGLALGIAKLVDRMTTDLCRSEGSLKGLTDP